MTLHSISSRKALLILLASWIALSIARSENWAIATKGKSYQFPEDHYSHNDFKTEWWYFTGNLESAEGKKFGFQVTWFRQGLRAPEDRHSTKSRYIQDHLLFAHLAISDLETGEHLFSQQIARGAYGETGTTNATAGPGKLVWVGNNHLYLLEDGLFQMALASDDPDFQLELTLEPTRPPMFNGVDGLSTKAPGEGNGSHYYSYTRLRSSGNLTVRGKQYNITKGSTWFDREWSTSVLGEEQVGWDWFSLNLSDGSDLMIYQLREKNGAASSTSSGTLRKPDGEILHLTLSDFKRTPGKASWTSPKSEGTYPTSWSIEIPEHQISLEVEAAFQAQEMALFPVTYWEGSVQVSGSHQGQGYMELTGYAGAVPLR